MKANKNFDSPGADLVSCFNDIFNEDVVLIKGVVRWRREFVLFCCKDVVEE